MAKFSLQKELYNYNRKSHCDNCDKQKQSDPSLYSALMRHMWSTVFSSGLPSTGTWAYWSSANGHKDNKGIGAPDTQGETEKARTVQLGEEKVQSVSVPNGRE